MNLVVASLLKLVLPLKQPFTPFSDHANRSNPSVSEAYGNPLFQRVKGSIAVYWLINKVSLNELYTPS